MMEMLKLRSINQLIYQSYNQSINNLSINQLNPALRKIGFCMGRCRWIEDKTRSYAAKVSGAEILMDRDWNVIRKLAS